MKILEIGIIELHNKNKIANKFILGSRVKPVEDKACSFIPPKTINYKISNNTQSDAWVVDGIMNNIRCTEINDEYTICLFIKTDSSLYTYTNYTWYVNGEKVKTPEFITEYKALRVKCNKGVCRNTRGNKCALCDKINKAQVITFKTSEYNIFLGHGCDLASYFIEIEYRKY